MKLLGLPTNGSGQYGGGSTDINAVGSADNPYVESSDKGVPIANSTLYQNDPLYRQAWDQTVAEHFSHFGKNYESGSSADQIGARVGDIYKQLGGGQSAGQPAAAPQSAADIAKAQQDAFSQFRATPGYQFGLDEGSKQVQASAAARGGLNSGSTLKALTKFGNDYADQQGYQPYANRLASLAGVAQTATNQVGANGTSYANAVGNNLTNAGTATANGIYGAANSWANGAQQVAGAAGQFLGSQYNPGGSSNATLSDGQWGGI